MNRQQEVGRSKKKNKKSKELLKKKPKQQQNTKDLSLKRASAAILARCKEKSQYPALKINVDQLVEDE